MPQPDDPGSMTFDPYDPRFLDDPYPFYRQIREQQPVFYNEDWDLTFVAAHVEIAAILKDRNRFGRDFRHKMELEAVDPVVYRRIYPPQWPEWTRYIRESFIDLEPPRHTRLRGLVSKALGKRSSESFRPAIRAAADRLLDAALEEGKIDAISSFATPIPVLMIADLMGIPANDHPHLIEWSNQIVKVFDQNVSDADGEAAEKATAEFVSYLEEAIAERRVHRTNDLISTMIDIDESGDSLTDEEIVSTSILTLNAGHEATVHAIGNGLMALAANPGQFERLRRGEVTPASAVDEMLRFDSPLQMFERWVLQPDVEIGGVNVVPGAKVGLLFGSGNHDQTVYGPTAEQLDLARSPNPHLAFGAGLHFCVGAPLARVELEAAFESLAGKVRTLDVESIGPRIESLVFRGVTSLNVRLSAA